MAQDRLAELAGLDRTYISAAEAGERNPTLRSMCKLADALGVDVIDLLKEDERQPE